MIGAWLGTDAERAVLDAITPCLAPDALRAVLLRDDVRASLLAAIQANRSPELTHALVDLIGPETMKMKGARVTDNLARLSYPVYAALASGEKPHVEVVKKQLLKRGWAAQDALMFTQATISVRAQNDKRRALSLEPSPAELPPGQLPKAGIKRRLTVPQTYDPLPTTDAQLALCGAAGTIAEARKQSAEELDPVKSEWARLRAACGSASVVSRGSGRHCGGCAGDIQFDTKRQRTCTHGERSAVMSVMTGAVVEDRVVRATAGWLLRVGAIDETRAHDVAKRFCA